VVLLAFAVLLVGTVVLFVHGLLAVASDPAAVDEVGPWIVASAALVVLPAMIGVPTRSDAIRRELGVQPLRTAIGITAPTIVAGLVAFSAFVTIVESLTVGIPVVDVLGAVGGAVGVGAASWILGLRAGRGARELRDGLRDGQPFPAEIPWDRRAIIARVLGIAGLGVLVIVVGSAVQTATTDGGDALPLPVTGALISVGAAAVVAGIASMIVVFPASRVLRPLILDLERPDQKRVLLRIRGTGAPLEPDHEWRAARIARACRIGEPFSSAGITLILAGAALVALGAAGVVPSAAVLVLTAIAVGSGFLVVVAAGYLGSIYALLMRYSSDASVVALAASPRPGAQAGIEAPVPSPRAGWEPPTGAPIA
jgi:hypothetical protein